MGSKKKPKPPPQLPEAPQLPDLGTRLGTDKKGRRRAAASTILTGGQGVTAPATTGQKTLLGQ